MARIFATSDVGGAALGRLRADGHAVEVWPHPEPPPHGVLLAKAGSGIAALITTLRDPVDREVLVAGGGALRVVAQDAVGLDNVDVAAATGLGIAVAHTADVLTHAVAEFAVFLIGAVARKLEPSERLVRGGGWTGWHPYLPFLGMEVGGKTLAVVGVGRIGRAVAARAVGLDMDILLCGSGRRDEAFRAALQDQMDLRVAAGMSRGRREARWTDLEGALPAADFVSLHVPLIEPGGPGRSTRHLIGAPELARMKPGACLVNTSRGPVVDEAALVEALRAERIAGAALDVFEREPLPPDSPLLAEDLHERVRVFHHFGSGTVETRLSPDPARGMAGRCVDAVRRVLRGEAPDRIPWLANGRDLAARRGRR